MSTPIVKRAQIPAPAETFQLNGTALEIGGDLAERVMREPLHHVLQALPADRHEPLLAGVFSELCAIATKTLGKRLTANMLRQMADTADRLPAEVAAAAQVPRDPEVH